MGIRGDLQPLIPIGERGLLNRRRHGMPVCRVLLDTVLSHTTTASDDDIYGDPVLDNRRLISSMRYVRITLYPPHVKRVMDPRLFLDPSPDGPRPRPRSPTDIKGVPLLPSLSTVTGPISVVGATKV